jgi:formamidopyrimidine-DNA glycosylase
MPELPEVETVKRAIAAATGNHQIIDVSTSGQKMRWPIPDDITQQIKGGVMAGFRRRGKYILIDVSNKHASQSMIIHLGMSGSVRIYPKAHKVILKNHDHMILVTKCHGDGATLVLNDPRRFGGVQIIKTENVEEHPLLKNMGVEPLGNKMNAVMMAQAYRGKTSAIKTALLDQRIIAGIGNIYASEILYRAGISPKRQAKNVSKAKLEKLVIAIKDVLNEAIVQGGTTLRDHVQPGGEIGYFAQSLNVYGRAGMPCSFCQEPIKEIRQTGRASFYCSQCQR